MVRTVDGQDGGRWMVSSGGGLGEEAAIQTGGQLLEVRVEEMKQWTGQGESTRVVGLGGNRAGLSRLDLLFHAMMVGTLLHCTEAQTHALSALISGLGGHAGM